MKRQIDNRASRRLSAVIAVLIGGAVVTAMSACSRSDGAANRAAKDGEPRTAGWTATPHVTGVARRDGALVFHGQASPGARVVLRAGDNQAFAVSADNHGAFDLSMPPPETDLLLTPEVQIGQRAAAGPERLFVARGGAGPIAILRVGDVTQRLDASPGLDAVDSDGRMTVASGRAQPDSEIVVTVNGQSGISVHADADGRWRLVLARNSGEAARISVGARSFDYPGARGAGQTGVLSRSGAGWSLNWSMTNDDAVQSVWLSESG